MGTTVEWLSGEMPEVRFTVSAKEDMDLIIDNGGTDEIGWLGMVRRVGYHYEVYRILLPKQEVHSATTEITPLGLAELTGELLQEGMAPAEISNLRLWGHSHVNMGVSPSGQDNAQMKMFTNGIERGPNPFFIRVVSNKKKEMHVSIFQYDLGIALIDAPWELVSDRTAGRDEFWKDKITAKVSRLSYSYPAYQGRPTEGYEDYYDCDGYGYRGYANYRPEQGNSGYLKKGFDSTDTRKMDATPNLFPVTVISDNTKSGPWDKAKEFISGKRSRKKYKFSAR